MKHVFCVQSIFSLIYLFDQLLLSNQGRQRWLYPHFTQKKRNHCMFNDYLGLSIEKLAQGFELLTPEFFAVSGLRCICPTHEHVSLTYPRTPGAKIISPVADMEGFIFILNKQLTYILCTSFSGHLISVGTETILYLKVPICPLFRHLFLRIWIVVVVLWARRFMTVDFQG